MKQIHKQSFQSLLPECVENEERIVELSLFGKVLQREESGVTEPDPGDQSQHQQSIASRRLVQIEDEAWVKPLANTFKNTDEISPQISNTQRQCN